MKTFNKHDLLLRSYKLSDRLVGTHAPNGMYLSVSPSCRKITGYSRKELLGKSFKDFSHPDDQKYIERMMRSSQAEDYAAMLNEYRFRKKNGRYAWFQTQAFSMPNNFPHGENLVTITRDITEMRHSDEQYQRAGTELAEDLARLGSWSFDVSDREMSWSKNLYRLSETYMGDAATLDAFLAFFPDSAGRDVQKALQQAMDSGSAFSLTLPFRTVKGKTLHVRVSARAAIEHGKVGRIFGIVQNVSEFVENEQQLKNIILDITAQKKYLLEYNQIITHNVKGPINSLSSLISFIDLSESLEDKMMFLEKAGKVADSIRTMLDSLTLSHKQLSQDRIIVEPLRVSETLQEVMTWLEGSISSSKAVIRYSSQWDDLNYNKVYLESILLNLLENALKYRNLKRRPQIEIATFSRGQVKYLTIEDNGSGINMDKFGEKIFQMHETFHKDRKGNGIGLFMIRSQIEAMGGQIRCESLLGKGTKFIISFNRQDFLRLG